MRIEFRAGLLVLILSVATLGTAQSEPAPPISSAAPSGVPSGPVTSEERAQVVEELAKVLEKEYLVPETGIRYAAMLRANLAKGAYASLTDPSTLGEKITADLQAVAPDRHLRFAPEATFGVRRPTPADAPASTRPSGPPGMEDARMIGDVAYLRFNEFPREAEVGEAARNFLLAHADAKAVIVDSRPNRGGGVGVMAAILPLLYSQKTTLVRADERASGPDIMSASPDHGIILVRQPSPASLVRYDNVVIPDSVETRLQNVPVYNLISRRTASAAEMLALAFKRTQRAMLIGETTAGANHFGAREAFGRFAAFVPVGRTYDPDTGLDWEDTGISPDVAVPADAALDEALKRAAQNGAHPQ